MCSFIIRQKRDLQHLKHSIKWSGHTLILPPTNLLVITHQAIYRCPSKKLDSTEPKKCLLDPPSMAVDGWYVIMLAEIFIRFYSLDHKYPPKP